MGKGEKLVEKVTAILDDETRDLSPREYQDLLEAVANDIECRLDTMKEEGAYED